MGSMHRMSSLLAGVLALAALRANGDELFPVGSENKARGIGSSVAARRGSAVLYNPANLTTTASRRAYAEVGVLSVDYAYEHPKFDPVLVQTKTPVAAVGYSGIMLQDVYLGVLFLPTKMGGTEIPGVPRDISGEVTPISVTTDDRAFLAALGVGYRFNRHWSLGISVVYRQEDLGMDANLVGNPDSVLSYQLAHKSLSPILGQRLNVGALTAAMHFSPAVVKDYSGSFLAASSDDPEAIRLQNYVPAKWGIGLAYSIGVVSIEAEANQERWAAGQDVIDGPSYAATAGADLRNIWNRSLSVEVKAGKGIKIVAGHAVQPTPWGTGSSSEESLRPMHGVEFGQLNGLDKKIWGIGLQTSMTSAARLDASLYHASGERIVNGGANSGEGRYQLAMTAVTGTLSIRF